MSNQPPPLPPPLPPSSPSIGYAQPAGVAPPIAYATPAGYAVDALGVFVNASNQIVSAPTVSLPHRCVKCNEPGAKRLVRRYWWHPGWVYALILPGLLVYAIVALVIRKKGTASISLCARHAARRRNLILAGWLVTLAMIAFAIVSGIAASGRGALADIAPVGVVLGILGAIISLVAAISPLAVLKPKYIDDREMHLAGAGQPFLDALAAESQYAAPPVAQWS